MRATRAAGGAANPVRCGWAERDPLLRRYHDEEWGVPVRDDRALFEHLVLDGTQAGLSWLVILRKRAHYRRAFAGFDLHRVAAFGAADVARLLADPGLVRNRLKLEAAITNARTCLAVQRSEGSLAGFLWSFTGGVTVQNAWRAAAEVPVSTPAAAAMSRALRARGFRFVGPTVCYAFMQAVGMVNDHLVGCFRHRALGGGS